MAGLQRLPSELLELVFRQLGSIDDVHHLGRACRETFDLIRRQDVYVGIMRSVILGAPQHQYDLQLCQMLDLHKKLVRRVQEDGRPLPLTPAVQIAWDTHNHWERDLMIAMNPRSCWDICCIPDEIIYDILARYQGLRVLESLWLERQLAASDFFSVDEVSDGNPYSTGYQVVVTRDEMFRNGELPARRSTTDEMNKHTALTPDQRARFYSAVTFVWLLNELRWVYTNARYPSTFSIQRAIIQACKDKLAAQRHMSLLDALDQYAMFKFLYHHLLPIHSPFLADQDVNSLPFTFTTATSKGPGFQTRLLQLFLTASQTYFQPPDLIDLAIRHKTSRRCPYPPLPIPTSTKLHQHPSQIFLIPIPLPASTPLPLTSPLAAALIANYSTHILSLIARSSFHQTLHAVSSVVRAPTDPNRAYAMRDYGKDYYKEMVGVAFDVGADPNPELGDVREGLEGAWGDGGWGVWGWAEGEDKARARLERGRERMRKGV